MKNKLLLGILGSLLGLGASASAQVDLIAPGATWRYLDTGVDPGSTWKNTGFNDAAWASGASEFGYGDGDEATIVSFGGNPSSRHITTYFRTTFNVVNPNVFTAITMGLTYDDGAVVYLNGTEVARVGMPAGAITHTTLASAASDYIPEIVNIPGSAFVSGQNTIAVEVHQGNATSTDLSFGLTLVGVVDNDAPTLITSDPPPSETVKELTFIGVLFSENVTNVNSSDLLINGVAATNMTVVSPREFQFTFPTPPAGTVEVAFAPGHGIVDLSPTPNAFAGANWSYTYDPNLLIANPVISEFLADNASGIEDEDGTRGDWLEIYNPGPGEANLTGWALSNESTNLMKWRFPTMILGVNRYLLIFASEKNKTNPAARLHTNFKLNKDAGGYLALSDSHGNPVSVFSSYPAQVTDRSYGRDRVNPAMVGYFDVPTPGVANTATGAGYSAEPVFSHATGVYTNDSFSLTISGPAGATIRYTTDGSEPTNTTSGIAYTGPITVNANMVIKARVFQTGLWPSAVKGRNFILLDSTTRNFNSNLPLVIITAPGAIPASVPASGTRRRGSVAIIDTFRGRASLTGKPDYIGMAQFETFGQTSEGFPKKPHNIELNDEYGNDVRASVLGLPEDADWKMRNPYSDKCLMNDFLAYEMFEQMGNYSCRRRFVEVFINPTPGTKLTYAHYYGVLVFLEKIETGNNRVNIAEMTPSHVTEPGITGGYMFKRDKLSTGDLDFTTTNGTAFKMHEPKPKELAGGITNAQVQWLRKYISLYEAAAGAADWLTRTGTNHYSHYIDVDTFVDQHWIVEFPKQIDGYRISNYFSKDRNGKIRNVPIWDWNLSFGNADYLQGGLTNGWYYTQASDNDHVFLRRLVGGASASSGDPEFKQKIVDRWSVLRTNIMAVGRVTNRIDEIAGLLSESAVRNYAKYPVLGTYLWPNPSGPPNWHMDYQHPTNYAGIISEMKKWTIGRFNWVDSQFVRGPVLSIPGGSVPPGTSLTMGAIHPIYYTLDGTDPRLPGGNVAPGAQLYSGAITLNANARVFARARSSSNYWGNTTWSGPSIGTFITAMPKLIISEIMYNPPPTGPGSLFNKEEFEFLEVKNTGTTALNLQNFRIRGGLDFTFPAVTLPAGQSGVIVPNQAAFQSRYGTTALVLGTYTNRLANNGDHLVLEGPVKEPILDFNYQDDWYPLTDGQGFSLVVANEGATNTAWNTKAGWRASGTLNGSPSEINDPAPTFPAVVVNEALTHTDLPQVDTVELLNTGNTPANIGGWYLSDDLGTPKKYRFPANTTIPANGYWSISEAQFNSGGPGSFSLSSTGDELYLFSADAAGNLTGYYHGFDFGPQANGVTFGRHVLASTGQDQFVAQVSESLETENAGPLVGPIVISEINYQPVAVFANGESWNNTEDEFIELSNLSNAEVALADATGNGWILRDAVDFTFPAGASIPANGYAIVAGVNTANAAELAAFRLRNNIPSSVRIYGPWSGNLDNLGDSVELVRPDVPNGTLVPYILTDKVNYSGSAPWPTGAGVGASMQRIAVAAFGNDPSNWRFTVSSPGGPIPTGSSPVITQQPQNTSALETRSATFTVAATGSPPISYQWHFSPSAGVPGNPIYGATSPILLVENLRLEDSGYYGCYAIGPGGVTGSSVATLTVLPAPKILEQPRVVDIRVRPDPNAAASTNASFSVSVSSGNPPISYQWRFNGANIPGATANVLTLVNVTTNNYGSYSVAVTDANGTVFSESATLYPLVNPVITVPPMAQTVPVNGVVGLSVQYSGFPAPFNVEWRRVSTPVTNYDTGALISQYQFKGTATVSSNAYRVLIKNRANMAPGVPSALIPVLTVADSDNDGIPDSVETALGLNPNSSADGAEDIDGDGMSNYAETVAGTDPKNASSVLKVASTTTPGVFNITFRAIAGHSYTVQYSDDLPVWSKLGDVAARAIDRDETVTDTTGNPNRVYRISTPGY